MNIDNDRTIRFATLYLPICHDNRGMRSIFLKATPRKKEYERASKVVVGRLGRLATEVLRLQDVYCRCKSSILLSYSQVFA